MAALLVLATIPAPAVGAAEPAKPTSHTSRQIEGWTVRVDDRLLQPPNEALGQRALKMLESKLTDITYVTPPEPLAKLRTFAIVLDLSHGKLRTMQYHPDLDWLRENGYDTNLVKCVHIPEAADLPTSRNINEQPWVIMHELAHAYHDQVLGFEDPRVLKVFEAYKKSGHGDAALLYDGTRVRHYGLTDQKEFFAEMTESYFGGDDFFPFNRAELITAAYRRSYFAPEELGKTHHLALASARAGNVIGGGDWGSDRLLPDCVRALNQGQEIEIRNPVALRPWQYVLEPLSGYLSLAERLLDRGAEFSGGWNFGPSDAELWTVESVVKEVCRLWGDGRYTVSQAKHPHEAQLLRLDASKARLQLGWCPRYSVQEALRHTVDWYRRFYAGGTQDNLRRLSLQQIQDYGAAATPR